MLRITMLIDDAVWKVKVKYSSLRGVFMCDSNCMTVDLFGLTEAAR